MTCVLRLLGDVDDRCRVFLSRVNGSYRVILGEFGILWVDGVTFTLGEKWFFERVAVIN